MRILRERFSRDLVFNIQVGYIEEANEAFKLVGHDVQGIQVENGLLSASIIANRCGEIGFMHSFFNRRSHFQGAAPPGMAIFAISDSAWYHGDVTQGQDLCGFNNSLGTTDCQWSGGMSVMYVPRIPFIRFLQSSPLLAPAFDRMQDSNNVLISERNRRDFKRMHDMGLRGEIECTHSIHDLLASMLLEADGPGTLLLDERDLASLDAFIRHCHSGKKLHLKDVLTWAGVCCTKRQLDRMISDRCGANFGSSAFLKRARLQQVRCSLERLEFNTIEQAAKHYGFNNISSFKRNYSKAFGLTAEQTIRAAQFNLV